jgi:hypothetical protein
MEVLLYGIKGAVEVEEAGRRCEPDMGVRYLSQHCNVQGRPSIISAASEGEIQVRRQPTWKSFTQTHPYRISSSTNTNNMADENSRELYAILPQMTLMRTHTHAGLGYGASSAPPSRCVSTEYAPPTILTSTTGA